MATPPILHAVQTQLCLAVLEAAHCCSSWCLVSRAYPLRGAVSVFQKLVSGMELLDECVRLELKAQQAIDVAAEDGGDVSLQVRWHLTGSHLGQLTLTSC